MFGLRFNERLAKIHFWSLFIAFNATFAPLFALGLLGMPRRVVTYPTHLQALNIWVSVSAFVIGLSMLVFLVNVVQSLILRRRAADVNPWQSKSIEWQLPTPVPVYDFEQLPVFDADPYPYGVEPAGVPALRPAPAGGAT
jgi:cytochrome c oxidase subunit 1